MDAFSLIVGSRSASAQPIMEANTDSATASRGSRAPRFSVQLAMKYRPHGDSTWRSAMTENISRSGVLFRAADDVDPQTPIELLLVLPGAVSGEPPSRLRCDGRVVRSTTCHGAERQSCLAAAIDDYRLATV